ncbi:MAG: hypothetical protein JNL08_19620 [Planctomycetes bacterium]|nr:hypothetical protein [Planctomycetota bacterium]
MTTRGEGPRLATGALLFVALLAYVMSSLQVTTDITHFLPGGAPDSRIELARRIATGALSRTMVLLVDCRDRDEAAAVSRAFEAALRAEPRVAAALASLDAGPPAGVDEALWQTYEPRRFGLLAPDAAAARDRLSDEGLRAAVARLKQRIASPMSAMVTRVAPGDPFLVLPALFERAGGATANGIGVQDDRFVTTAGDGAVLFLTTTASASDSTRQRPLLDGVAAAFAAVRDGHGSTLRLWQSGASRHAIAAEDSMRADMQRVSVVSLAGIVLLYLLLFRSLQPMLLSLPVLGAGFLAGSSAVLLCYGRVHGLTLAFGAALLGVAIDYSLHFFSHLALAPDPRGPRATLQALWRSLSLCTATTVIGFAALLLAAFPGLRELALFAAVGLGASLAATWLLLPGLARPLRPTRATTALVRAIDRLTALRGPRRGLLLLPAIAVAVVIALGLPHARWDDGIGGLNRVDAALKAEDDAVRARVAPFEQRRVVVATGTDEQAALAVNDRIATALAAATAAGEVDGASGIAQLLPSAARQREVDAVVRGDATLWPRLHTALTDAGFVADGFLPFAEALAAPAAAPLLPGDLDGTPLATLVRPFRDQGPQGPIVLSFLHGVRDEPALRQRLAAIDGAALIDIEGTLTGALTEYRSRMLEMLLLGVGAVVLVVALRQRAVRPTLVALVPPLVAATGTAATLALCGQPLNLMSLMALLMVVSMGDDYGIFLVDDDAPAARDATHLSVVLSSLTTMLGFGLLALSDQPALFAIGATSMVGIGWCVLLALPSGAWFVPPRREPVPNGARGPYPAAPGRPTP